jgi:predicted  nucleic acid-binding Zn-ribbon protein
MAEIRTANVELSQSWGVQFGDYYYGSEKIDLQDLMVAIAENRAVTVEQEVNPLSTRIKARNAYLEELGDALADLTRLQAAFKSDDEGNAQRETMKDKTYNTIYKLQGTYPTKKEYKQWVEYYLKLVKSKIDALNNQAQTDMTRLQALVDRRDEAYSTATTLMTAISDTRSNLIRNL